MWPGTDQEHNCEGGGHIHMYQYIQVLISEHEPFPYTDVNFHFNKTKIKSSCYSWVSRHKFHWGLTPNRYTVIRLKKIFAVCVDLVFGSKCVQFHEICLLQCSTIINTFWVDPHSELLKKVPVKPKNNKQ